MIAALLGAALAAAPPAVEAPTGPDRSGPPDVLPPPILDLPEPEVHHLAPGLDVWTVRVPEVRKVAVDIVLRRGMIELDGSPTENGRALGWMAEVAGGELDAGALAEQRDLLDISLDSSLGLHSGRLALRVPTEDLQKGLDLTRLVLAEATFPKKELKRYLRDQALYYTVTGPSSPSSVARSALAFAWFPADHPYGRRPDLDALERVRGRALRAHYARWKAEAPVVAIVVGDVSWDDVSAPVTSLLQGVGVAGAPGEAVAFTPPASSGVVAVAIDDQEQVSVRLRYAAPWENDPDRAAYETAAWALGGHFLSRLNTVLREEKGYTYGADAIYQSGATWGSFTVAVDVREENLLDTVRTIEAEVARLVADGPDEVELEMARRSFAAAWNDTFLTADSAARLYLDVLDERSTVAAQRARIEAVDRMTAAEVRSAAAKWFAAGAAHTWVLVGDRDAMTATVDALALPAVWTDPRSAILGSFEAATAAGIAPDRGNDE